MMWRVCTRQGLEILEIFSSPKADKIVCNLKSDTPYQPILVPSLVIENETEKIPQHIGYSIYFFAGFVSWFQGHIIRWIALYISL